MDKRILLGAVAIIVILIVVFFSQKEALISGVSDKAKAYVAKGSEWVMASIYPKISGEVKKRGDMIKNEVTQEKNKVSENIGEKISNYFSGVENSIVHPGDPQNCPAQTPPAK